MQINHRRLHRQVGLTMMYDTMNLMKDTSDNDPARRELSDKFTSALNASCAVACKEMM